MKTTIVKATTTKDGEKYAAQATVDLPETIQEAVDCVGAQTAFDLFYDKLTIRLQDSIRRGIAADQDEDDRNTIAQDAIGDFPECLKRTVRQSSKAPKTLDAAMKKLAAQGIDVSELSDEEKERYAILFG